MKRLGYLDTVDDDGSAGAVFVTADDKAPLIIVSGNALGNLFMPQQQGKGLFVKPNAPVLAQLNDKGIPTSEIKKAWTALSDPRTVRRVRKGEVCKPADISQRFAREARLKAAPAPVRIGAPPSP